MLVYCCVEASYHRIPWPSKATCNLMASGVPLSLITGNGAKGTSFPKQHFFNKFPQQVRLLAAIADVASERVQKFDGGNLAIAGWALATLGMGQHRRGGFVGQSRENRVKTRLWSVASSQATGCSRL